MHSATGRQSLLFLSSVSRLTCTSCCFMSSQHHWGTSVRVEMSSLYIHKSRMTSKGVYAIGCQIPHYPSSFVSFVSGSEMCSETASCGYYLRPFIQTVVDISCGFAEEFRCVCQSLSFLWPAALEQILSGLMLHYVCFLHWSAGFWRECMLM